MKKFQINHAETYEGAFIIEAENEDEAMQIFRDRFLTESMSWMYFAGEDTSSPKEVPSYIPTTTRN